MSFESESANDGKERRRRRRDTPLLMPCVQDRLPPHSIESEQIVLGCILLDPKIAMPMAIDNLRMNLEPFYDMRHQALYVLLAEMFDKGELIELVSVMEYLRDRNQLEALGGMTYLMGLQNLTPAASVIEHYIEILNEKAYKRRTIQICTGIVAKIYDGGNMKVEDITDEIESKIMELTRKTDTKLSRRDSFLKVIQMLEDMHEGREVEGLIKTGFQDLDTCLDGLYPGDQIVIAARPGLGKSTLAMNIAEYNAIHCDNPVGYFSMEMSADKLNMRTIASYTRTDLAIYRDRDRNAEYATHRISVALPTLVKSRIDIEYTPGISIMELRSKARQMAHQNGIKLIVVDMIQLVTSPNEKRNQEVGEVSRGLKALAGELNIPIVSISSMNREIERSDNRRPRLSDLKESGDIESDADVVLFLWQKDPTAEKNGEIETEVYVAKNRNGKTGEFQLRFMKRISRFESVLKTDGVPVI